MLCGLQHDKAGDPAERQGQMTVKTAPKPAAKPATLFKRSRKSFLKTKAQQMTAAEQSKMMAECQQMKRQIAKMEAAKAGAR